MSVSTCELPPPVLAPEAAATMQLVSLRLAGERYGVAIDKVQEVILPSPITPLPQGPAEVLGLINLRNTVVPIIDLRRKLGLDAGDITDDTRIVVVNLEGRTIGLWVDGVDHVLRLDPQQLMPPPEPLGMRHGCVIGVTNLKGGLLILLDLDRLFAAEAT